MDRVMDSAEAFKALAAGRVCTVCGSSEVVIVSVPGKDGVIWDLSDLGKRCYCAPCAQRRFAPTEH